MSLLKVVYTEHLFYIYVRDVNLLYNYCTSYFYILNNFFLLLNYPRTPLLIFYSWFKLPSKWRDHWGEKGRAMKWRNRWDEKTIREKVGTVRIEVWRRQQARRGEMRRRRTRRELEYQNRTRREDKWREDPEQKTRSETRRDEKS